jgi:uncharacterized membrane protein
LPQAIYHIAKSTFMGEETSPQTPVPTTASEQLYMPSSAEKKRAITMYLLIGIMGSLSGKQEQSVYERFHLKQAMGRWTSLVLILIATVVLLFIPYIKYIPLILLLVMIVVLVIYLKQANDGKYGRDNKSSLSLFAGIGDRMLGLFEVKEEVKKE